MRKSSLSEKVITWTGQDPQDFQDAMIPKGMKNFSFFSDEGLQAVIPAANGTFTANSLAKIYAMLANQGEWDGQQLIRPEVFKELSTIQSYARDRVMPIPMNWRLGYHRIITMGKRAKMALGILVTMVQERGVILSVTSALLILITSRLVQSQAIIVCGADPRSFTLHRPNFKSTVKAGSNFSILKLVFLSNASSTFIIILGE